MHEPPGGWRYTGHCYQASICEHDGLCWHSERDRIHAEEIAKHVAERARRRERGIRAR